MIIKSKEEGKCQESIQLVPHLNQNTFLESDKRTRKRHLQNSLDVSSDSGPSPFISKWSDGGNHRVPKARNVESTSGVSLRPIVRGSPPRLILSAYTRDDPKVLIFTCSFVQRHI